MPNQPQAQTGHPSKLLAQLAHLGAAATTDALPCFAERLSRLFGLGDTMTWMPPPPTAPGSRARCKVRWSIS